MHRKTAALIVSLLILPSAAYAQDRGSDADQEACTPDVFRLCQEFIPNEAPILACLQSKRTQLSPACGLVIFPAAASAPTPDVVKAPGAKKHAVHGKHHKKKRKHPASS